MPERRFGVLIANSEFPEEAGLLRLACPENDVDGLCEALTRPPFGLFSGEDVLILKNLTHFEILPQIEDVLVRAGKDDLVLLYYSGHGKQGGTGSLHLATRNTTFKHLTTTSIPVQYLKSILDERKKSKVVLILDCCYSGLVGEAFTKSAVDDQLQNVARGRGTYILTASTKIQVAVEKPGDRYSLLTKHIIEGIQTEKADRDEDGLITMDDLYSYVHDHVMEEGAQEPEKHALNVRGDLIIARTSLNLRQERRAECKEILLDLFQRKQLPPRVFTEAIEILAKKPGDLTNELFIYDQLLDRLATKEIGAEVFLAEWALIPATAAAETVRSSRLQRGMQLESSGLASAQTPPATEATRREKTQPLPRTPYRLHQVFSEGGQGIICAFTPDGNYLASCGSVGVPRLYGMCANVETRSLSGLKDHVSALAISPDGTLLAAAASNGEIALWNLTSPGQVSILSGHRKAPLAMAFHPEGRYLASAGHDDALRIWDTSLGREVHTWQVGLIHALAFSPDSRWNEKSLVLLGGSDGKIRMWNPQSGEQIEELQAHSGPVYCLRFAPNGKILGSAGRDGRVRIWETTDWSVRAILQKHRRPVLCVAITPDGETLASASADYTVKLWRTATGEMASSIDCGQMAVESIDFSPDGRLLATGGADGTIRLWEQDHTQEAPRFLAAPVPSFEASPRALRLSYDFNTGDGIEKRHIPFVIGVLANLSERRPGEWEERTTLRARRFVEITRPNFDHVMAAMRPRVSFTVSVAGQDSGTLEVDLTFTKVSDFDPDSVVRQIPLMSEMAASRARLAGLQRALTHDLETPLRGVAGDARCVAILEDHYVKGTPVEEWPLCGFTEERMAQKNASEQALWRERLAEFWKQWITRQKPELSDPQLLTASWIRDFDLGLSRQLDLILLHPDFRTLEATWRGLEYLVSRVNPDSDVKVRVLNASKKDMRKDVAKSVNLEDSSLFKKLYDGELGRTEGEPFGVLIGDYYMTREPRDFSFLSGLSNIVAKVFCPFIAAAAENLLKLDTFDELSGLRDLGEIFATEPYKAWRAFRESDGSRYVALVLPRILVRPPYREHSRWISLFDYREGAEPVEKARPLWGNPVYAMAAHLADFHQRYGWFSPPQGEHAPRLVQGLPVTNVRNDQGDAVKGCPVEIAITDRRKEELMRLGFVPLCHAARDSGAHFPLFSSCHTPGRRVPKQEGARAHSDSRLDTVLAVSRLFHYITAITRVKAHRWATKDELQEFLNTWLRSYVHSPETVSIRVSDVPGSPGTYQCAIDMHPDEPFI